MQANLLFSNGKSRPLFRNDMSSFFSLFNVFLCSFLLLCLPFSAFCAFFLSPFSFVLFPHSLYSFSSLSRISTPVFFFFFCFLPIFLYFLSIFSPLPIKHLVLLAFLVLLSYLSPRVVFCARPHARPLRTYNKR